MAATPQPVFTPDASIGVSAGAASAAFALPGTPANDTSLRVTNVGSMPVALKLGTDNTVTVTSSTGLVVMPGRTEYIGMAGKTWAALTTSTPGATSTVNLTTGN